jgi:hypothetical protein
VALVRNMVPYDLGENHRPRVPEMNVLLGGLYPYLYHIKHRILLKVGHPSTDDAKRLIPPP